MADGYQKEIPKSRINITLDVEIGGAKKKKELPLKLLILGDFAHQRNAHPISQRDRLNINKNNFDQIMAELKPELHCIVPNMIKQNGSDLKVHLIFKQLSDFHPSQVVAQIPELNHLLAMRNLLKELKSNILDNVGFRQVLEKIVVDKRAMTNLRTELREISVINQNDLPVYNQ